MLNIKFNKYLSNNYGVNTTLMFIYDLQFIY